MKTFQVAVVEVEPVPDGDLAPCFSWSFGYVHNGKIRVWAGIKKARSLRAALRCASAAVLDAADGKKKRIGFARQLINGGA
jgi:hypothetical protein